MVLRDGQMICRPRTNGRSGRNYGCGHFALAGKQTASRIFTFLGRITFVPVRGLRAVSICV